MSDQPIYKAYAIYSTISLQLVIAVVAGWLAGSWLDKTLNTKPIFLVIGIILGMIIGIYNVFKLNTYYQKQADKENDQKN